MKIIKLHIKNFGKFNNTSFDLSNNLNLFFGLNESGKTMIVDAIEHSLFSRAEHEHQYLNPDVEMIVEMDGKNYTVKKGRVREEGNKLLKEFDEQFEIITPRIFKSLYCVKASEMEIEHERDVATKLGELLLNIPSINKIESELKSKLTRKDLIEIYNFSPHVSGGELEQKIGTVREKIEPLSQQLRQAQELTKMKVEEQNLLKELEKASQERDKLQEEEKQLQKLKKKEDLETEINITEDKTHNLEELINVHKELEGLSKFSESEKEKVDEIREKQDRVSDELMLKQNTIIQKTVTLEMLKRNVDSAKERFQELQSKKLNLQKELKLLERFDEKTLQNIRKLEYQKFKFEQVVREADALTKHANEHQADIDRIKRQKKMVTGYGIAGVLLFLGIGILFIVIAAGSIATVAGVTCVTVSVITGFGIWVANHILQEKSNELNQKIEGIYARLFEIAKECEIQEHPLTLFDSLNQTINRLTQQISELCIGDDVKSSEDFERKVYSRQILEKELADVDSRAEDTKNDIKKLNPEMQKYENEISELNDKLKQLQERYEELKRQEELFYRDKGVSNYFQFEQQNKKWQEASWKLKSKQMEFEDDPKIWDKKLTELKKLWHRLQIEYQDYKNLEGNYDERLYEITSGKLNDINEKIRELENERFRLRGGIEKLGNLDEVKIQKEIEQRQEELRKLELEARAYAEVARILKDIKMEVDRILVNVYKNAEEKFAKISGHTFKIDFEKECWKPRLIDDAGNELEASSWLSSGALHQLYFCLRLALIEYITKQKPFFIILDDPFVFFDKERLRKAVFDVVLPLSRNYQFIITTMNPELKEILHNAGAKIIDL